MSVGLYLMARIAGRAVAFAAADVETVVDLGPVTPTPRAVPGVVGLAALRSRVAAVIDPRAQLGLDGTAPAGTRAVVGTVEGHLYAVLVESLDDVADYLASPLPPGIVLDDRWAEVGVALIDRAGEPVLVVSLAGLIPSAVAEAA